MSTKAPKRFDRLWHDAVDVAYVAMQKHARDANDRIKKCRREAYRFAAGVAQMLKHYNDQLHQMIKSEGVTVEEWMNDHFAIVEAMGETRERLYAAIEAGVTEREYVNDFEVAVIKKRRINNIAVKDDGVIPKPRVTFANDKDKADHFIELYQSMVSKYQGRGKELRDVRRDLSVAMARIDKMERTIGRLKKDIEKFYAEPVPH